jgi:hypothetical protein
MNEPISREEHKIDIDKISKRIDKQDESILRTELAVSKIESSAEYMEKTWLRIHDELYNKDGLKERVLRNCVHKNIHWALISTIVLGIIGRALWVLVNTRH